ncbi:dynein axonemal assembly factor 8 isoform X2 [Phacochoerus africanus]|uniref:dynein axonemal assembly factor 8 isoform X2 n=1 Tax=Phacochoerus africanus TaxID=41426 RepID=UPI001FD88495|nr:dynein axonemal assembly factor 8 isoform X2 [Phacochoerus africanus]
MGPAPMAFHNKDVGPLSPSPWDTILEAVREQLPSLDSDSSLSDCEEEELFIFQRDQTTLIPDLSEELAEDPAGPWVTPSGFPPEPAVHVEPTPEPWRDCSPRLGESTSLEGRAPGGPLQSCGQSSSHLRMPVEAAAWQEDEGGRSFNTSASQSGSQGPQGQATLPPGEAALQTEGPGAASGAPAGSNSTNRRGLRRERRKMIKRDILHKVTGSARHPACQDPSPVEETPRDTAEKPPEGPQRGLPMHSLQQLEEWDLDQVLQSLTGREDDQGDGAPGATCCAADHLEGQDHAEPNTQDRLMERLVLLCARQSRASPSARRAPADMPQDKQQEAGSRCVSRELGFQTLAENVRLRGPAEPPTIFIDLRPTKPSDQGSLDSSSSSSSSSNSEEEEEEEAAAQRDPKGPTRLRYCTGKSQLLQQLRAFQKATAQPQLLAGEGPSNQKAQGPGDTAGSSPVEKQHCTLWAERQSTQARHPEGSLGALGDPLGAGTAREDLVPALGQL